MKGLKGSFPQGELAFSGPAVKRIPKGIVCFISKERQRQLFKSDKQRNVAFFEKSKQFNIILVHL